jgi:N-acetylmuramoyl-L-alanine amidase
MRSASQRPRGLAWLALVAASLGFAGCSSPSTRASDGGPASGAAASEGPELGAARSLAAAGSPLPERASVLAVAESIEARAVREAAGVRAVELHTLAAHLFERVWRVEGREQDAQEAIDVYREASRDANLPGACEAALDAARLAGDVTHDATAGYAELYRAQRRFAYGAEASGGSSTSSCGRRIEGALALLAAFRPPQRVLEAIDQDLAGEGAVAQAVAAALDAGGATVAVESPQIVRIESWPGREAGRVVVTLDRPAAYRVGDEVTGGGPPRTFVDLDGVDLGRGVHDVPAAGGIVTRIRAEATTTGSRISLDLEGRAWRRVFHMLEPYRIVVDVARNPPGVKGRSARHVSRVVLDPGHGGKDTGAVGPAGLKEKDVTLDIAHRVAPVLAAQGVQVVLTRDDDRFVSLEERTARANAFGADLFVSVHCNASEAKGRRGVETYVLDTTRDEVAARVAARENATTQAASLELASILGGMRMADEAQRSMRLARLLQRAATVSLEMKYSDTVDGGVHTAGFYVLVGARMPSVLFEVSYVSNAVEEARLASEDYRQLVADAIANAVKAYREGR